MGDKLGWTGLFSNVAKYCCPHIRLQDSIPSTTWRRLYVPRLMVKRWKHSMADGVIPTEWCTRLKLKSPKLNVEYLCDPSNTDDIYNNIQHRKGVGDINKVVRLWEELQKENNDTRQKKLKAAFTLAALQIPNMSYPHTPVGDEACADVVEVIGVKREFNFKPRTMVELGESLGLLRTAHVIQSSGHKSYYFIEGLARLEQALLQYTLKELKAKGFQLVSVPDLLNQQVIEGCGLLVPEGRKMIYKLDDSQWRDVCLAGTAEMSIAGYCTDEVFDYTELPKKFAAVSRCYRAETSDIELEKGIYRVHQFTKVEMFGLAATESPDQANSLLLDLLDIEKELFSKLGLHFRILEMPTEELGAPAHRKFDVETWMAAKQFWGEISSASNCTDYQSRRLSIQYRDQHGGPRHCATVNGTACAVPRTIMAICENFQQQDGTIDLPEALWEFMDGERLEKNDRLQHATFTKEQKLKK